MANVSTLPGIAPQRISDQLAPFRVLVKAAEEAAANKIFRIMAKNGLVQSRWADKVVAFRQEWKSLLMTCPHLEGFEEYEKLRAKLFEGELAKLVPLDYLPRYRYEAHRLLAN